MGVLVYGVWSDNPPNEKTKSGHFVRKESFFRNWIAKEISEPDEEKNTLMIYLYTIVLKT